MTQLMREAVEALTGLLSKASPHDPHKGRSNEGRWVTINASREQVEQARSTLSHLTEELRRQDAFDVKEAERALQWAIRAARNGAQITEHERIEAQCALMSMLNLLDGAAAAQALHTDQPAEGAKEDGDA